MSPWFGTGVLLFKGPFSLGRWMQNISTAGLLNIWRPSNREWIKIPMIYWNMVHVVQQQHVDFSTLYERNIIDIVIYLFGDIGITVIQ